MLAESHDEEQIIARVAAPAEQRAARARVAATLYCHWATHR